MHDGLDLDWGTDDGLDLDWDDGLDLEFEPSTPPPPPEPDTVIAPQKGPQTAFLESRADIVIYGGAAGGGKSFALLLEVCRHVENPNFGAVIFRRESKQVRNEGGLWHESMKLYPLLNGTPRQGYLDWRFPSGMRMSFAHLEYERSVHSWQGTQIAYIGFDELTHFTQFQFFYMLSRNRSASGVPGYVRATCNPDCDSWVRKFIDWWIGADGYAIPERSGVIRWFVRIDNDLRWANSAEELKALYGDDSLPTSVTFIPATVYDNQILLEKDPSYLAKLKALSLVDRMRLLGDMVRGGNWDIRNTAGNFFKRHWFPIIDAVPSGFVAVLRFWDRAATQVSAENPSPDWTRGLLMYRYPDGTYVVADVRSLQDTPGQVEKLIKHTAEYDGHAVEIMSQCDPGSAGKAEAEYFIRMLAGFAVSVITLTKDKVSRAKPVSAQAEAGNIKVLRAAWNDEFFAELENFPDGAHDDIVDTLSGAFNKLCGSASILDHI